MIKRAIAIIITLVLCISVVLVVFAYNTLEKRERLPDHYNPDHPFNPLKIQYMVNVINFDNIVLGGVLEGNKITFTQGAYTFQSVENVEHYYMVLGDVEFTRYRTNVYNDDPTAVQYTEGVPVYINLNVWKYTEAPAGKVYDVKIDKYFTEFTFEQFARSSTYVLDYQEYMDNNEPKLQPPERVVDPEADLLTTTKDFFNFIGDYIEYLGHRIQFYTNYIVFYVQDYSLLFSLKKEGI